MKDSTPIAYPVAGEPLEEPLLAHHDAVYMRPARDDDKTGGCCSMIFKLIAFHFLNVLLGLAAHLVIDVGVTVSILLLPLCCLGLVFFRVVLYAVRYFARLDVKLYNFISSPKDHVYLNMPEPGVTGRRLSPNLKAVTPLSLMATFYFLTIKLVLSTISLVVLAVAFLSPVIVIGGLRDEPPLLVHILVTIAAIIISIVLMHLGACLSRSATRFFCCERFSTYHYIHSRPHVYTYHA